LGHCETQDTSAQNVTFRELMCINIETIMSENQTAAETDVFRSGDTAHSTQTQTHTTYRVQLSIYSAAVLAWHSNWTACKYVQSS
jgi:hypothetical protein